MTTIKSQIKTHKTPKLRFSGFSCEWEEKRLDNFSKINPTTPHLPEKFIYIDLESVKNGQLLQKNLINRLNAPSRAQRVLNKGDIIFQTVRPYQQNNFFFNFEGDYVASTGYAQIRAKEDSLFLYQCLHTYSFLRKVLVRCTGSSYPAINSNDLKSIKLAVPHFNEQQKIATFLSFVDEWLENIQTQKENLEKYKKGMMQKIFSQAIRFKDHNGKSFPKWEEKKLGEILKERKEYSTKGKGYPHISLTTQGVVPKSERYNRDFLVGDDEVKGYKITRLNDLCYNPANLKFGVISINKLGAGIFSPIYVTFEIIEQNIDFVGYYLIRDEFINKARRYEQGTVYERMAVSPADFVKVKVAFPSLPEQQKIADFLTSLDKAIEAKQQQITLAENWKKGLMQGLFI